MEMRNEDQISSMNASLISFLLQPVIYLKCPSSWSLFRVRKMWIIILLQMLVE